MKKTNRITMLALFIAIEILLAVVPFLGYVPIGVINATTLHIPVIAAGILLGKKEGGIVGLVFGITSVVKNTIQPTITSFIFSPFITIGGISGSYQSLIIAIVPRVLIGFLAGLIYEKLAAKENKAIYIGISAFVGSIVNTILVMGLIFIFFGHAYANALSVPYNTIISFIMGVIATNGIAEALLAVCINIPLCKAGQRVIK
ncbi:MAG: ECF transporter S component [Thomasclavelia sp.]|jgi:uncharacterized membrane protein|nr:ECF transporter S component [Thomasclavelia sp.]